MKAGGIGEKFRVIRKPYERRLGLEEVDVEKGHRNGTDAGVQGDEPDADQCRDDHQVGCRVIQREFALPHRFAALRRDDMIHGRRHLPFHADDLKILKACDHFRALLYPGNVGVSIRFSQAGQMNLRNGQKIP
jgi:hypothetical protein